MRDQQAEASGARVIDDIGQQCCTEPATLQIGADDQRDLRRCPGAPKPPSQAPGGGRSDRIVQPIRSCGHRARTAGEKCRHRRARPACQNAGECRRPAAGRQIPHKRQDPWSRPAAPAPHRNGRQCPDGRRHRRWHTGCHDEARDPSMYGHQARAILAMLRNIATPAAADASRAWRSAHGAFSTVRVIRSDQSGAHPRSANAWAG